MRIQVLGCSAVDLPYVILSSFLIDQEILLDAGTIGGTLHEKEQRKIKHILITNVHLDHIKDIHFFADNISVNGRNHSVTVFGIPAVNPALRNNLLNSVIWPNLTKILSSDKQLIKVRDIIIGKFFKLGRYNITAYAVNHNVPAVGYLIEDKRDPRTMISAN